ncbi:MAG: hypothetical protein KGL39_06700 [Patescibacteria group bacterium]|nr:hypothetical protein [Patescibacteria group bacterium]
METMADGPQHVEPEPPGGNALGADWEHRYSALPKEQGAPHFYPESLLPDSVPRRWPPLRRRDTPVPDGEYPPFK